MTTLTHVDEDLFRSSLPFLYLSPGLKLSSPKEVVFLRPTMDYSEFEEMFDKHPTNTKAVVEIEHATETARKAIQSLKPDDDAIYSHLNRLSSKRVRELVQKDRRYNVMMSIYDAGDVNFGLVRYMYIYWLQGKVPESPTYAGTSVEDPHLNGIFITMNQHGFLTCDSQSYMYDISDVSTTIQRPYIVGIMGVNHAIEMTKRIQGKYQIYVVSHDQEEIDFKLSAPLTYDLEPGVEPNEKNYFTSVPGLKFDTHGIVEKIENPELLATVTIVYPNFDDPDSDRMMTDVMNAVVETHSIYS